MILLLISSLSFVNTPNFLPRSKEKSWVGNGVHLGGIYISTALSINPRQLPPGQGPAPAASQMGQGFICRALLAPSAS